MKGDLSRLMKQAQKMQDDMQKAQAELSALEVTGQAGGGMVSITMNCKHEVRRVSIEPSLPRDDLDMLEDLIAAACNDALRKVEATTREKFSGLATGMGLPGGFNLPL